MRQPVLHRLLDNLNSVFDKDAEMVLAARIRYASGSMTWTISDGRFRTFVTSDLPVESAVYLDGSWYLSGDRSLSGYIVSPSANLDIPLEGHTVGSLVDLVSAQPGYVIPYIDPALRHLAARVFLDGAGDQSASNGDHFYVFTSLLWSLLDAYSDDLYVAESSIVDAIKEAYLHSSDGVWLDLWCSYFGVVREPGETDQALSFRTVREVLRPRNNGIAIQNAVKELTGFNVSLKEPWKDIFTLDFSALSDRHHFQDGSFYTWNVFQPVYISSPDPATRDKILRIINRNRPAGSLIVAGKAQPATMFAAADLEWLAGSRFTAIYNFGHSHYQQNVLSSSLYLSDSLVDAVASFSWSNHGNIRLIYGSESPLNVTSAPATWAAINWPMSQWGAGSPEWVVTQS